MPTPVVRITRKAQFSAAHFFWVDSWSEAENAAAFGPVSNQYGHGHNYTLWVTLEGPIDPTTGMLLNLKDLKQRIEQAVILPLNFKNLNHQVPAFSTQLPTLENLVVWVWQQLAPCFERSQRLVHIRLAESDDLWADYSL